MSDVYYIEVAFLNLKLFSSSFILDIFFSFLEFERRSIFTYVHIYIFLYISTHLLTYLHTFFLSFCTDFVFLILSDMRVIDFDPFVSLFHI